MQDLVLNLWRSAIFFLLMACAMGLYQMVQQQRAILYVLNGGCLQ